MIIENWSLVVGDDLSVPPELRTFLHGTVYGHPTKKDGTVVTTTRVIKLDSLRGICVTEHRVYTLGVPDPEYVKVVSQV